MNAGKRANPTLLVSGPGLLEFVDGEIGEPDADQVLVAITACGICGSDLRPYRTGVMDLPYFGHEFAGIVAATGSGILDLHPGDRVASGLALGCGSCDACLRGFPNFCEKSRAPFSPGGFARFCLATCTDGFRPLIRISDSLDDIRATCFEPLSCAMRIVERAEAAAGSRVLVLGLGMMGVLSALLLKRNSPGSLVAGADNHPGRVDAARGFGLDVCALIESGNAAPLREIAPDFDLVIDATGVAAAFAVAIEMARLGGRVVLAGVPQDSVPFSPLPIFRKELTIAGAKGPYPFPDGRGGSRALDLLASPDFPWDRMISVHPFGAAQEAFRKAARGDSLKGVLSRQAVAAAAAAVATEAAVAVAAK